MLEKINHYALSACCKKSAAAPAAAPVTVYESRYDVLDVSDKYLYRDDKTGAYTPQGAATDGVYLYRALVAADDAPTLLQKINLSSGEIILERSDKSYGHANDMTYANGKLYIAHSSSTSTVYELNAETLDYITSYEVPLTIWGIAYDPTNNLFILGGVGSAYLSVYYPDFKFMYRIKPENSYSGLVRQGIFADSNYIYIALDNAYGAVIENNKGSRIMVYTWNGMFIKSLHIPIPEIEWAFPLNGFMYIGTYEGRDASNIKSGKIYKSPFDLYPEQTNITGRPTDVSGGLNNLQRLPEGTPVRLWAGSAYTGTIKLDSAAHKVVVDEDSPFRYLRFRFKGANQNVFDWYPQNTGVVCMREVDITAAAEDSNLRIREARLSFNPTAQTFTIDSNFADEIKYDKSEDKITFTKYTDNTIIDMIEITQIWGVV